MQTYVIRVTMSQYLSKRDFLEITSEPIGSSFYVPTSSATIDDVIIACKKISICVDKVVTFSIHRHFMYGRMTNRKELTYSNIF